MDGSWWIGRLGPDRKEIGVFPSNHVEILDPLPAQAAQESPNWTVVNLPARTNVYGTRAASPEPEIRRPSSSPQLELDSPKAPLPPPHRTPVSGTRLTPLRSAMEDVPSTLADMTVLAANPSSSPPSHGTPSVPQDLSSVYERSPLKHTDSIRLLILHPAEDISPIHISLSEVRLQDTGPYKALSYTLATEDGNSERSSEIRCGGASIWVTKNCEAALRRIRSLDSERTLWVDAICINQRSDKERGHQVGNMRDIYNNATQTLIWLGEASKRRDPETDLPFSTIFLEFLSRLGPEIRNLDGRHRDPASSLLYQKSLEEIKRDTESWFRTSSSSLRMTHLDLL